MDIAILSSSYHREDSLLGRLLLLQPTGSSLSERLVEILALRKDALQARKAMAVVESLAKGRHGNFTEPCWPPVLSKTDPSIDWSWKLRKHRMKPH